MLQDVEVRVLSWAPNFGKSRVIFADSAAFCILGQTGLSAGISHLRLPSQALCLSLPRAPGVIKPSRISGRDTTKLSRIPQCSARNPISGGPIRNIMKDSCASDAIFDRIAGLVPALRLVFARFDTRQIRVQRIPCLPHCGVQKSGRAVALRGTALPTVEPPSPRQYRQAVLRQFGNALKCVHAGRNWRKILPPGQRRLPRFAFTPVKRFKRELPYAKSTAFFNGNLRMRVPVRAKIAFASAGAAGGVPGSPIPRIFSPFSSTRTAIGGH